MTTIRHMPQEIVSMVYSGTVKNCTVRNAIIKARPHYTSVNTSIGGPGGIVSIMAGGTVEGCTVDENTVISGVSQMKYEGIAGSQQDGHVFAGGVVARMYKVTGYPNMGSVKNNACYAQIEAENNSFGNGTLLVGGIIGKISGSNLPTISSNHYSGTDYGIGYDLGGNATDEPGCIKDGGSNNNTGNGNDNNGGVSGFIGRRRL